MGLDGLEVLVYGLGFLILVAFGVWLASIVAIFTAKNPAIKTLAIMLNLLILSVVILAVIKNAGEQAYEESRYQENDKELLIDGIRIPAGSRLVVEPQMGIKKVPDFSTFSRVEYLHPIDWKGVTVGEMERVVSQYDGHYEATLTTRSGNGTGGVVEVEGWRCRSDNDMLWGVKNENGRKPSNPADYRLLECLLDKSAEVSIPQWPEAMKLPLEKVRYEQLGAYWEADILSENLPYWGKVYFDADKRISSINLSFSQKNLQGCAIADEGASLEWDSKQPDVVTIRSYVDLPEYCWGKKVVRPVSKDGEQRE